MACAAFRDAKTASGLKVWRVENMDLKPIPEACYGTFYTGDAYIILYSDPRTPCSYNVHSWTGREASQDESGAAAIFMTQLDEHLGGAPVQFTEFQEAESTTFTRYFKKGLQYKKGGVASGFQHVVTNDMNVKRLLHVKGRRYIRSIEVDMSWNSFNKGDCFVIDLGENIFHWSGSESNRFERLKTTLVAKDIRDDERGGRAEVHMINEGEEPTEVIELLGPKPDLAPASSDTEGPVSKKDKCKASLYMISDAAGPMQATLVAEKNPFKQTMLNQDECYIVDNRGDHKLFLWKGKNANVDERKAALLAAQKFIKDHNCSCKTQIQVLPDGGETVLFKDFFFNWTEKDETTGLGQTHSVGSIACVKQIPFDASSLHNNKAMAAQHGMVDDGSGEVKIWRVEAQKEKVPVDASTYGQFYGGDCYLVQYSYNEGGCTKHLIYTWQGRKCSRDELAISALLTVKLDDSMGGVATQVRVTQGQEPPHLVSLFKKKPLIVYLGGTSREGGQTTAGNIRLFHIRLSSTRATRAVEVEPMASSLNSNDVFVLKTPNGITAWKGEGADEEEMVAAKHLANVLGGSLTEVKEKREPDSFWAALGGKKEYQTSKTLRSAVKAPRLFACSNKTGRLIAEELHGDFTQADLVPDDIMILDTWDQIYVWIGREANEEEKQGVMTIAQDYIASDPSGRCGTAISTIKQEQEPPSFTGWFQAWDPDMWERQMKDMKDLLAKFNRETTKSN